MTPRGKSLIPNTDRRAVERYEFTGRNYQLEGAMDTIYMSQSRILTVITTTADRSIRHSNRYLLRHTHTQQLAGDAINLPIIFTSSFFCFSLLVRERSALATLIFRSRVCPSFCHSVCPQLRS